MSSPRNRVQEWCQSESERCELTTTSPRIQGAFVTVYESERKESVSSSEKINTQIKDGLQVIGAKNS